MAIFLLTFASLFVSNALQTQNYKAVYNIVINDALRFPIPGEGKDTIVVPVTTKMRYTACISLNYMTIYVEHLNSQSNQSSLKVMPKNIYDTLLVDIRQSIAYSTQERVTFKLKKYELLKSKNNKDSCNTLLVAGYPHVKVISCKSIPQIVNPSIAFFKNNLYGIKIVKSEKIEVQLTEFSINSETIDHKLLFSKLNPNIAKKEYDILNIK
ncbi:MAG: hypothetical protein EAZ95_11050 [Bacteroidetes bacterium]|nr:MAG: hypothetical protein EAZ95_11050 [Bacteroidota bacterium]